MPAWEIKNFGGVIPRMDERLIPDNMAAEAVNCDFTSGKLVGLPCAKLLIDLSAALPVVERAYRFPAHDGSTVWLPLPSRYSSVVRSPVVKDQFDRVYWTNPGDVNVHFNTAARIQAGQPPFDLGIVLPSTAPTITGTTGGTAPPGANAIDRSYLYTFVNAYGEESAPSTPSNVFSGPPDAMWHVTGFPTTPPANPAGHGYPVPTHLRIYRTITALTTGAQFFLVGTYPFPTLGALDDNIPDSTIVLNDVLVTTGYANPPDHLDGLVVMPGGFLAGFVGRDVFFSEPYHPYAWPDVYAQTANYEIVGMAVWQQYLMVMTKGYSSVAAGASSSPSNLILTQTQVAEPCISRGSIVVDLGGVFYASQNGLIQFTGVSMNNLTGPLVEKNEWLRRYRAEHIFGARHRSQYIAVNESDYGFLIDYAEARLAFEDLGCLKNVVAIWNDEYTGDTLVCANEKIYEHDCPDEPPETYRWKSKRFFTPMPLSLGAVQVELDPEVLEFLDHEDNALDNGDPKQDLPAGVNAQFRYYAGPKLDLITTRNLTKQMEIFRLPNGFRAFDHQVEIISRVPVTSIQVSTTLAELKRA